MLDLRLPERILRKTTARIAKNQYDLKQNKITENVRFHFAQFSTQFTVAFSWYFLCQLTIKKTTKHSTANDNKSEHISRLNGN